ncbi:MAG: Ig-like domain-containing protein [Mycobacterium sp.]
MRRASACVGRVGGLAVALGIGAAVSLSYPDVAWAAPTDDTSVASSASESAGTDTPRSRRSTRPKATAAQHNDSSPVVGMAARAAAPKALSAPTAVDRVGVPIAAINAAPPAKAVASPLNVVAPAATTMSEAPLAAAPPAKSIAAAARFTVVGGPRSDLSGNGAPAESAVSWAVYAAVRRPTAARTMAAKAASSANPIQAFFFNQTPTESPTQFAQSPDTGAITGDINAADPDSDVITYSVDSGPTKGTVTVDSTGRFVYTPDPILAHDGLTDSFRVTVSDAASGFHLHGIMGLLNLLTFGLFGGEQHSTTTTVNLTVTAINKVPTATTTVGAPDPISSVVTGTVTGNDPDGDPLAYTGSTTSKGTAVVTDTGGFTYTPTASARHAAAKLGATVDATSDTFIITVADDHGGALAVPITTAIVGANVAPTATGSAGLPNVTTGLVAGAVIGSDADADPLTYSLSSAAAKGSVTLNANGSFTYTPTALARHNAAFNSDTTDSFTVTVTDGYGGAVNVAVSVTISPASVTFDWANGSGSQYWTAGNVAALNTAATRLSSYIVVATPVTITTTLIGQNNPSSNFLASSYTNFSRSGPGYYGTVVQTKILTGADVNGASADSQLTWNFAYPWALGDTVPGNQYDFQSVAMHEIVHSLGVLSGISSPGNTDTNWSTYDSFLSASDGTAVIDPGYNWNTAYNANLTGGNGGLYFDGPNAVAVYGGLVPLYTPSTWASGSSVTHLSPTPVKPTGTTGYLMDPSDGYGLGVRVITPVEIGILKDLGYTIVTPSSASVFFLVTFGLLRRRRR